LFIWIVTQSSCKWIMRYRGLDLNLLVALEALLSTRSVSRAAERLNLGQPAMSAALGRLRDYFRDELLVVEGKRMHPTAFAQSLHARLLPTLEGLDELVTTSAGFDPATSERSFRIAASDYIIAAILAPVVARLATTAPSIRVDFIVPGDFIAAMLDEGKLDLVVTPEDFMSRDHPADLLCEERHVVAGWSGNPVFQSPMTAEAFYAHGHVAVAFGVHRTPAFGDRHVELTGRPRRVAVIANGFTALPWLLVGTDRLAVMHERLARSVANHFPIAIAELPFEMPAMREMVQYHRARAGDDGLSWLRRQILDEPNRSSRPAEPQQH
jgi:DNA-binding transcriptional LysR family regulator